mmetsp:Transcript_15444/g.50774  ORF Transcript_15444/g.50774 Transcript_15444/m.50774 type:complete len:277 (-) Transcript_15444:471-1301(-)
MCGSSGKGNHGISALLGVLAPVAVRDEGFVDDVLVGAHFASGHHRPEHVHTQAEAHQAGDVRHVVRRAHLYELHPAQPFGGDEADEFERLAREKAAGLRPAGAGDERRLKRVDVVREIDGVDAVPRAVERHLRHLWDSEVLDVLHREDVGAAAHHVLHRGARHLPPANPDLHQVLRRYVREVGRVEPWRRVHPLVQVLLLDVGVPIHVDDANLLRRARRDAPYRGEPDRVVPAQNQGEGARARHVRHRVADLVEALLEVGRNRKDVAGVAKRHLLP